MTKPKQPGEPTYSYTFLTLKTFCDENNIILNNNYDNIKINRDTKIFGKCLNKNCNENFNKVFRQLFLTNGYCSNCTKNNKFTKLKNLQPVIRKNVINTCLKKYGVENVFQNKNIKNKIIETNLNKHGVKFPQQSKIIRNKSVLTYLNKYGCENPQQNLEIKQKTQLSNLEIYGVTSCILLPEVIKKRKEACINKYGNEIPLKTELGKEQVKQTCLKKYGVENPSQNPEISEKTVKNSYRKKIYTSPSGKKFICQGYEPFALDNLIKEDNNLENEIITCRKNVPTIWYNDNDGKKHRHFVDIFIPSQNKCIEVKSTWTFKKKIDCVFLKQNAAKELGHNYEIWVYNSKGEIVEKHL